MGFREMIDKLSINLTCDRYWENNTGLLASHSSLEGIPETLALNAGGWLALLILFAILRKMAWDYGRIALVNSKEERKGGKHKERWMTLFYGNTELQSESGRRGSTTSSLSLEEHVERQDQGLSWFASVFRLKDDAIATRCGHDAIQYLHFQQYLIVYMAVVTSLSLAVIMPINFTGREEGPSQYYGHTTISNLNSDSALLWIHTLLAMGYLIMAVVFMRRFSAKLMTDDDASRTLMVSYIPKDKCFKNTVLQHFKDAYPDCPIHDVQFSFNICKLAKSDDLRRRAHEGRTTSEGLCNRTGERPMMAPHHFGRLCCCCQRCGCRQVDAIDYYTHEEERLEKLTEQEKIHAFQDCTGIAFIIFETPDMAQRVYMDYNSAVCSRTKPRQSSISREVHCDNWDMEFAPDPNDINWQNLSMSPVLWWLRAFFINGVLIIVLFFLTTPTVLLNDKGRSADNSRLRNVVQSNFLPSLLLWFFSVMLPYLVYYSDQFIGHWTKTREHHTVMRKTFVFLLLMVVILPSLGLPSAKALIEFTFSHSQFKHFRWVCIFLPGNGAFFVNYVVTSAFVGNALTLMRFPELTMYVFRMMAARSAYEQMAVRRSVIWEFQFGQEYAWMLCVFTTVMVYSIPSPLVTPFGLIYLVGKHFVDRYNLFYAYKPSKINHHIHTSAINYVIVSLIILQFTMLFFNILRTSWRHGLPVFSGTVVVLSLLFFVGRMFFGWFRNLAPIKYRQYENKEESMKMAETDIDSHEHYVDQWDSFMPSVLREARVNSEQDRSVETENYYGATDQIVDADQLASPQYISSRGGDSSSETESETAEEESEAGEISSYQDINPLRPHPRQ